jgi:hypothetical protein
MARSGGRQCSTNRKRSDGKRTRRGHRKTDADDPFETLNVNRAAVIRLGILIHIKSRLKNGAFFRLAKDGG